MKRRTFLYNSILLAGTPLFGSDNRRYAKKITLLKEPYQTLEWVLNDLFPPSKSVPGIKKLNTIGYFQGVMQDRRIEKEEREFIANGIAWLNEACLKEHKKRYWSLSHEQREKILKKISLLKWGDNWLRSVMSYLFESMLCDPVYGANADMSGWKWLEHTPGHPRPLRVVV